MSIREKLTMVLWLVGAIAAGALSLTWILAAADGKLNPFALATLMWSVALGAGFVHQLREARIPHRLRVGAVAGAPRLASARG